MYIAEVKADVEETEHADEKTVENVPNLCASVNVHNETIENKTSVSTEGPDCSDVMSPDSAGGNADTTLHVGGEANSVIDTAHLNADSDILNPLSPVNSPVHIVRTLITQDDPLGLFTNTVTSVSSKTTTEPRTSRSSDSVIESARMEEESVLTRRISEDAIGRTSWVAAATDSSLRKCSSLNRLSSECAHCKTSAGKYTTVNQVTLESDSNRPSSASPRTSLLGGTFRSAASRFASKYREFRESMVPPSPPGKVALPVPSGTSQEQYISDAGDTTPTDTTDVTNSETDDAAVCNAENTDTVGTTMPDITVTTQSGRSRLRVPTSLYSPLGKFFVMLAPVLLVFLRVFSGCVWFACTVAHRTVIKLVVNFQPNISLLRGV